MTLLCDCYWSPEPGNLAYWLPEDFEELKTSRRKRCGSCKELIDIGALAVRFDIYKIPEHEIEINIYGEDGEAPRAPVYFCERCGEIYFNLAALGFCVGPWEDMRELLKEYQDAKNSRN